MKAFPANVCGDGCKRLRGQLQCFASEKGKTSIEIATPILDKRKDGSIRVTIAPRKYLLSRFTDHYHTCRAGTIVLFAYVHGAKDTFFRLRHPKPPNYST